MKVAIFKCMEYGFDSFSGEDLENCDVYIRTTEYVDVEFPPLETKDVVIKQIDALKDAKKKIQAATELRLGEFDRRIGDLLALPQAKDN